MNPKEHRRILVLLSGLTFLSLSLILYLTYFMFFQADAVKKHSANRRSWIEEAKIQRGIIRDRNADVIAYSKGEEGDYRRFYNYPRIYSHIVGYANPSLGKGGLELSYNDQLLNKGSFVHFNSLKNFLSNKKLGNNLNLTIDTNLQNYTHQVLEETDRKCAAVILNPKTGEIYSMVSLPDFDASTIVEDWSDISSRADGPLVNRVTQGLYPPGSTFKILTSVGLLENPNIDQTYIDEGTQTINGRVFKNAVPDRKYGKINLRTAFSQSLNTYFVSKGVELGSNTLGNVADRFMFNKTIDFDLPVKKSVFNYSSSLDDTQLAASSIGQGKVLATPLEMALVSAAIANDGKMMEPYLVAEVESADGVSIDKHEPKVLSEVTKKEVTDQVKELMIDVVRNGNGSRAYSKGLKIAGKTGTAENSSGKDHAWFVGFAPASDPKFAIAVIVEQTEGYGGTVAAPIARDLLRYANKHVIVN